MQTGSHLDEIVQLSIFDPLSRLQSGSLPCASQRLLFFSLSAMLEYSATFGKVGLPCIAKCLSHFVETLEDFLLKSSAQSMKLSVSNSSLSPLVGNC